MATYAVCSECDFLRVRAERAQQEALPQECPNCGGELVIVERDQRFAPAYVGRVARSLHGAAPLPGSMPAAE